MSALQNILDEKWPLSDEQSTVERHEAVLMRCAFTEGYNAGQTDAYTQFNEHLRQMEYMRNEESKK